MENKDKKIWSVFGAEGFVGSEFCKQFSDEVIRIDKLSIEPQTPYILFLRSTTDNYNVHDSPTLDIETNLLHFMDVLDSCHKKYGNKFEFNLISSWFVYGGGIYNPKEPLTESALCNPKGFYSITARCREQLLISYCETFGIKYSILRLANVLGSKDKKVSKKKNALQYIIDRLIHNEDVGLYNGGKFYRDYIDVRDCAKAIKLVLESDRKHLIYNISNGQSYLFRDLVEFSSSYSQSKSNIWDMEKPDFHATVQVDDVFLSNERLKELGYKPEFTIWQTLQTIINDYKR